MSFGSDCLCLGSLPRPPWLPWSSGVTKRARGCSTVSRGRAKHKLFCRQTRLGVLHPPMDQARIRLSGEQSKYKTPPCEGVVIPLMFLLPPSVVIQSTPMLSASESAGPSDSQHTKRSLLRCYGRENHLGLLQPPRIAKNLNCKYFSLTVKLGGRFDDHPF